LQEQLAQTMNMFVSRIFTQFGGANGNRASDVGPVNPVITNDTIFTE